MPPLHDLLVPLHVFGVVIGMGAAFASDAIFLSSLKDGRLSNTELRILKLGGKIVWIGLGIIVLSGMGIFFTDPERYLASDKFLAKMTIILVLVANGIVFHALHIPRLHRHAEKELSESSEFRKARPLFILSGAVSMVSWISAFILGSFSSFPLSFLELIGIYALCILGAVLGGLLLQDFLLSSRRKT